MGSPQVFHRDSSRSSKEISQKSPRSSLEDSCKSFFGFFFRMVLRTFIRKFIQKFLRILSHDFLRRIQFHKDLIQVFFLLFSINHSGVPEGNSSGTIWETISKVFLRTSAWFLWSFTYSGVFFKNLLWSFFINSSRSLLKIPLAFIWRFLQEFIWQLSPGVAFESLKEFHWDSIGEFFQE